MFGQNCCKLVIKFPPQAMATPVHSVLLLVVVLLSVLSCASGLPRDNFYPFGLEHGDSELPLGNTVQARLRLEVPLHFLVLKHRAVYVNTDGILTFDPVQEKGQPPYRFGVSLKNSEVRTIAPFGADYNTSESGRVFYREDFATDVRNRASSEVIKYFGISDFRARSLMIITWLRMRFKDENEFVSFQLVAASDGDKTFVFCIYDDENRAATNDRRVVGFSNGRGSHLTLIGHVSSLTNVNLPGVWVWQVGGANLGIQGFGQPIIDSQSSSGVHTGSSGSASGRVVSSGSTTVVRGGGTSAVVIPIGQTVTETVEGGSAGGSSFTLVIGEETSGSANSSSGSATFSGSSSGSSSNSSSSSSSSSTQVVSVRVGDTSGVSGSSSGTGAAGDRSTTFTGDASRVSENTPGAGRFDVDLNIGDGLSPSGRDVCSFCHSQATCQKFTDGYCCVCPRGMFGNGRACLERQRQQRLNGLVSGTVNGHSFSNANLHSIITLSEARTYTGISPLEPEISYSLQSITPVAEILAWLFALPSGKGQNGFTLTGGVFTQTLNITFSTGEQMLITQEFKGLDDEGYIRVVSNWNGNVPRLWPGAYIYVDDHKEEYVRHRLGVIHTFAKRSMQVNDTTLSYTMDQTIEYDECLGDEPDTEHVLNFMRLSLTETYLLYEINEKILRFSMIGKVSTASEQTADPCVGHSCHRNAQCLPAGDTGYKCKCNAGYEGSGTRCTALAALDLCAQNNCDANAYCIPQSGTYNCACNTGYTGDGFRCSLDRCAGNRCDRNARCVPTQTGYQCYCNSGFSGDGYRCEVASPCDDNVCHANAYCTPSGTSYRCFCNDGYRGDGYNCQAASTCDGNVCHVNAYCTPSGTSYRCICNEGYQGDGNNCEEDHCVNNECDINAYCASASFGYRCYCNPGYLGDGYSCRVNSTDACANLSCDPNANCLAFSQAAYECSCNEGYIGDGFACQAIEIDPCADTCDANAQCVVSAQGTYQCICNAGFSGDGFSCAVDATNPCDSNACDWNAHCVVSSADSYGCICNEGHTGNGFTCEVDSADPCANNACHRNARCLASSSESYECSCLEGYSGDGLTCEAADFDFCRNNNCDANARCVATQTGYQCFCNQGYEGDGYSCQVIQLDPCANSACDANAQCVPSETGYSCICNTGFNGNGYFCQAITDFRCQSNTCSPNARCIPTRTSYKCYCNAGYTGDGFACRELSTNRCINNRCDFNAECLPAPQGSYTCRCNEGFEGDGFVCRNILVNLCSACDVNAQCQPEVLGYRCVCNSGFTGNGLTCEDIDECSQSGDPCHRDATCYNVRGSYSCYCKPGYEGDGFTCQVATQPELDDGTLIYTRGMAIMRVPLNPNQQGSKIIFRSGQTIVGLGYDCRDEYLYWTDVSGRTINRVKMDGSDSQVVVSQGLSSPESVAVDWLSRNIYWTDSGYDRIEVANLDGRNRLVLIDQDLVNPRAVTVDPVAGLLYWTDWNRNSPRIERANMDGSGRIVLVESNLGLPNGLSLDYTSNQICWADAGTKKIECMNMNADPLTRFTVYPTSNYPFSLTSYGFKLYWSDWDTKSINSISKTGGQESTTLKLPRGGNGRIYGLAAATTCPGGSNACSTSNGGCSNLCLPIQGGQRKCACGTSPDENEVPCV